MSRTPNGAVPAVDPLEFGGRFLRVPDLFPCRLAGEGWGQGELAVALPGGTYRLSALSPAQRDALARHFGDFLAPPEATEQIVIRTFRATRSDFLPSPEGWHEYELDLGYDATAVRLAGSDLMGLVNLAAEGLVGAVWTWRKGGGDFLGVVENLLRVVSAYRLLGNRKALVHSAAIARGGEALLFPGRSGAGKTTVSALADAAGWEVVSDELNVVAMTEQGMQLEQVPFAGDFGRAERLEGSLRLRGICQLEQADDETLRPASPGEILGRLLAASPYLNRDPYRSGRLEEILAEIATASPGFVLGFTPESRLEVLDELVAPGGGS